MSQLLEILGRGLLAELRSAFAEILNDDDDGSTADIASGVQRRPDDVTLLNKLAIRMLTKGHLRQAYLTFQDALKIQGHNDVARLGLACVMDEQGAKATHVRKQTGQEIYGYFGDVIDDRSKTRRDDLMTELVHAEIDGERLERPLFEIAGPGFADAVRQG